MKSVLKAALRYRLEHIRPFIDDSRDIAGQPTEAENGFLREAQRMLEIYPDGLLINRQLAAYHLRKKSFAAAARHAGRLIANFPDHAEGYQRMGDIQREQQAFADALPFYRKALDRADRRSQSDLHKSMWACYFGLRQYRAAYRSLKKAINYFSPHIATADLYRMAQTSYQVGRFEEARILATFAAFKTEKKSPRQEAQISNLLKSLEKSYQ